MLYRGFEEEVVSRRKNARPSRRQKHDTLQCMFLSQAKQGGGIRFRARPDSASLLALTKSLTEKEVE
jgi:hypothetical protein